VLRVSISWKTNSRLYWEISWKTVTWKTDIHGNINLDLAVYLWEFRRKSGSDVGYLRSVQISPAHSHSINAPYPLIYCPENTAVGMVTSLPAGQERNRGSTHCKSRRFFCSPELPHRFLGPPNPLFFRKLGIFHELERASIWSWALISLKCGGKEWMELYLHKHLTFNSVNTDNLTYTYCQKER
jgi:hypothetical protein